MRAVIYSVLIALLFTFSTAYAEQGKSSSEKIDVKNNPYFIALIDIKLKKKQTEKFKKYMNEYAMKRGKVVDREKRKNEALLPKRIKNSQAKIRKSYVKKMSKLLDDDQFNRFPAFHAELDKMLAERESLTEESDPDNLLIGN